MTFSTNPLTREQKLIAEIVVQLANVVEQLQIINGGGEEAVALQEQVTELQQTLASVQQEKADLLLSLQQSQSVVSTLQTQVATTSQTGGSDLTPDNITQVMQQLGINYEQD